VVNLYPLLTSRRRRHQPIDIGGCGDREAIDTKHTTIDQFIQTLLSQLIALEDRRDPAPSLFEEIVQRQICCGDGARLNAFIAVFVAQRGGAVDAEATLARPRPEAHYTPHVSEIRRARPDTHTIDPTTMVVCTDDSSGRGYA